MFLSNSLLRLSKVENLGDLEEFIFKLVENPSSQVAVLKPGIF